MDGLERQNEPTNQTVNGSDSQPVCKNFLKNGKEANDFSTKISNKGLPPIIIDYIIYFSIIFWIINYLIILFLFNNRITHLNNLVSITLFVFPFLLFYLTFIFLLFFPFYYYNPVFIEVLPNSIRITMRNGKYDMIDYSIIRKIKIMKTAFTHRKENWYTVYINTYKKVSLVHLLQKEVIFIKPTIGYQVCQLINQ